MSLTKKLYFKTGYNVALLNAPDDFALDSAENISIATSLGKAHDAILWFVTQRSEIKPRLKQIAASLKSDGSLWIAYPKKSGGVETDLTRDVAWQVMDAEGWRPTRQIKADETWSALRFVPKVHDSAESELDAQYAEKKAALRPIYDALIELCNALGDDVTYQVRKSYVAAARKRQFAVIKPSTQTRVDLALKLPGEPFTERLKDGSRVGSGSVSHVVALKSTDDIDNQVQQWLQQAYINGV